MNFAGQPNCEPTGRELALGRELDELSEVLLRLHAALTGKQTLSLSDAVAAIATLQAVADFLSDSAVELALSWRPKYGPTSSTDKHLANGSIDSAVDDVWGT